VDRTNSKLLERVRFADDREAWQSFFQLYYPLLAKYARLQGLRAAEAEDVAQDCMALLARHMPGFRYSRLRGRFRGLLRTIVSRRIATQFRRRAMRQADTQTLANLSAPADSDERWEKLWLREHMLYCLRQVRPRCAPQTFEAFRLYALKELPVQEVCRRLGLTPNQVYVAKARIIRRLRRAVCELIGEVI
jgi:RNA polymerase sigma-70 factor, ECF subfamily